MSTIKARILPMLMVGSFFIGLPAVVHADADRSMHRGYQSEHHRGGHDRDHFADRTFHSLLRHAKELGLSEEQVVKLKTALVEYKKTRIRDKATMQLAEVDVRMLVHDKKADIAAIEGAVRKAEAARATLRLDTIRAMREAVATLTPEQLEKWRSRPVMHAEVEGSVGDTAEELTQEELLGIPPA
jgi:Spy/CpxP family protein refolding chaperone